MNWAYLDKAGILHLVPHLSMALPYTAGEVVETDIPAQYGFPLLGDDVVIYEDGKCFIHGNEKNGHEISTPEYIQSLVEQIQQGK